MAVGGIGDEWGYYSAIYMYKAYVHTHIASFGYALSVEYGAILRIFFIQTKKCCQSFPCRSPALTLKNVEHSSYKTRTLVIPL